MDPKVMSDPSAKHKHSSIRTMSGRLSQHHSQLPHQDASRTVGERLADQIAAFVGSWPFVIGQSLVLVAWIIANVLAWFHAWDPYPFILLNLVLSFQAAYTAPVILMSQNRQAAIDRLKAEQDYMINTQAEIEIQLLHQKIDLLREQELIHLVQVIERLESRLQSADHAHPARYSVNSRQCAPRQGCHGCNVIGPR